MIFQFIFLRKKLRSRIGCCFKYKPNFSYKSLLNEKTKAKSYFKIIINMNLS